MDTFNEKELEILFDAVGCWETEPSKDGFSNALMGMMLPNQSKKERETQLEERLDEASAKSKTRQETAILIRAKIVQMKNCLLSPA